jgi:hypothetical protein
MCLSLFSLKQVDVLVKSLILTTKKMVKCLVVEVFLELSIVSIHHKHTI